MHKISDKIVLEAEEELYQVGSIANDAFLVLTGEIQVYSKTGVLLARIREGNIVGEMAFFRDGKRETTLVAGNVQTILKVIDGKALRKIAGEESITSKILRQTQDRLINMNVKVSQVAKELGLHSKNLNEIANSEILAASKFLPVRKQITEISREIGTINNEPEILEKTSMNITGFDESSDQNYAADTPEIQKIRPSSRLPEIDGSELLGDTVAENWEIRSDETRISAFISRAIRKSKLFGIHFGKPDETIVCVLADYSKTEDFIELKISSEKNFSALDEIENELFAATFGTEFTLFGTLDDRFFKIPTKFVSKQFTPREAIVRLQFPKFLRVHSGDSYRLFKLAKGIPRANLNLRLLNSTLRTHIGAIAFDRFEVYFNEKPDSSSLYEGGRFECEVTYLKLQLRTTAQINKIDFIDRQQIWRVGLEYHFSDLSEEDTSFKIINEIERKLISLEKGED